MRILSHAAPGGVYVVLSVLNMAELCSVSGFFLTTLEWVLSCGGRGRGREGIEGTGQRLAKSDKKAVGRREERTARGEGKGKKESKPGWVVEIEERVTESRACYRKKKKDSERVGEADIKG